MDDEPNIICPKKTYHIHVFMAQIYITSNKPSENKKRKKKGKKKYADCDKYCCSL